jgi:hypothetical protein
MVNRDVYDVVEPADLQMTTMRGASMVLRKIQR